MTLASASLFDHIPPYAGDPILSLMDDFANDRRKTKVSLSVGLYFDENGQLPVLKSIKRAQEVLFSKDPPACSYLPMEGDATYRQLVQHLVFGTQHPAVKDKKIATIQSLGGSGALRVGADFLHRYFPQSKVWVSDPTWENHVAIFEGAGMQVSTYPYYDSSTGALKFEAMLEAMRNIERGSIVLLHACCHNPTGVDLTKEQWLELIPVLIGGGLIAFIDMAYQGFGQGPEEDAWPVRELAQAGAQFFVANSFSKNFSLYGERCGALHVVCLDAPAAQSVLGQLKATIRRNYSSPPTHGARLISTVLSTPKLKTLWQVELAGMRDRIINMRMLLHAAVEQKAPGHKWDYLLSQRGMFSYTGLSAQQVEFLRSKWAIYLVRSGRMCMTGLTNENIDLVARALAKCVG